MSKEDRNTAITVAIILVACFAALIAVGTAFWNLVGPSVNETMNVLGKSVQLTRTNYNFPIPEQYEENSEESSLQDDRKIIDLGFRKRVS